MPQDDRNLILQHRLIALVSFALASVASGLAGHAWGQAYPNRPVRMMIPQPAGGTMDTNARALAEPLARELGQNIVIDNRSGANGIIAGEMLAKAMPDGYTVLYTSQSLLYNQVINKNVPFDALRDFAPVTQVAKSFGYLVLVNPQVQANSIRELADLSKRPGKPLHYGSGGVGNAQHFLGELINLRSGAKFVHVPYKGLAPVISALLGNEVQVAFATPTTVIQHIKAGKLRALAYTGEQRWSGMPELPTMMESGITDFTFEPGGHGIFAPSGTPAALITLLQGAIHKVIRQPKMMEHWARGGYVPIGSTPQEFRRYLEDDLRQISEIARIANIEVP